MPNYKSSLEFLMDKLDISGKEISEALGIDESLVSKWKNNTRPLHLRTPYLSLLVTYLLNEDRNNFIRYRFIKNLISEQFYDGQDPEYHNLHANLSEFLTTSPSIFDSTAYQNNYNEHLKKHGQQVSAFVFKGNYGRQAAILEFFNTLFKEPLPQDVCIVSQEDLSWMIGEERFLKKWIKSLSEAVRQGHNLTVIYWIDRPIAELGLIFNLYLPLYLKGNITTYFIPKYTDLFFKCSLHLVKNKVGLWGMEGSESAERHTMMFSDKGSLAHYHSVFQSFVSKSKKLMTSYHKKDYHKILNDMSLRGNLSRNSIMVSKTPSFVTLSEELFEEMLVVSGLPENKAMVARNIYKQSRILEPKNDQTTMTFIFNKAAMSEALKKDSYNYQDLSLLIDQEVVVPLDFFRNHLYSMIKRCETSAALKIGLTDVNLEVDLFIQDENFFFCWNFEESEKVLLFYEHNLNRSIFHHYDQIWKEIPSFNKSPEFFRKKLADITSE